ncbi:hypothetical protein F9C07_13314 [Aspergillus flavus]|uniref:Uncharacterized protein n=1 Tax=Aspergillus flavus (strain ATCC 200026 / FGSC A1120 / IAM 13836 / NRRL 3357 / JCM 12722 / SRRC 167) TaxID=332952 RepID=A0A7U2R1Z1_ASPFN|nr:hypothetical protein F9C07_13314 [Aspergillus flavus]
MAYTDTPLLVPYEGSMYWYHEWYCCIHYKDIAIDGLSDDTSQWKELLVLSMEPSP